MTTIFLNILIFSCTCSLSHLHYIFFLHYLCFPLWSSSFFLTTNLQPMQLKGMTEVTFHTLSTMFLEMRDLRKREVSSRWLVESKKGEAGEDNEFFFYFFMQEMKIGQGYRLDKETKENWRKFSRSLMVLSGAKR